MAARRCRMRTFPAVVAGVLAAVGLVLPAAASERPEGPIFPFANDVPAVGALNVRPEGGPTTRLDGWAVSLIGAFGSLDARESAPVAEAPVVSVSAPIVVSAEALWTFDELAFTINSTITEVDVGLRGHQAEIDRCAGPVVSDYGTYGKVIGEHNHCGGAYVLELEVGDIVRISGYEAGDYVVASLMDVPKKNTPVSVLSGADLFLQTCHFTGGQMRLVALAPN